jgi:VWFA-related protein
MMAVALSHLICAIIACIAAGGILLAQPSFKSAVDLVRVTATVMSDGGRRPVRGLTKDDFVIIDGGREQPIVSFSTEPQAMSVVFLIDISASMRGSATEHARQAMLTFVRDHFGLHDEALICVFNARTICANRWSRDPAALSAAMAPIPTGGATRVLDAVAFAVGEFDDARHHKQVLVLLSDGKDVDSERSPRQVASILRQSDVLRYAIGFPSSDTQQQIVPRGRRPGEGLVDLPMLRSLTDPTGGLTQQVTAASRIGEAVGSVAAELGHQYFLAYAVPAGPPGFREIAVRLRSSGDRVRARRGYQIPERGFPGTDLGRRRIEADWLPAARRSGRPLLFQLTSSPLLSSSSVTFE